MPDNETKLNMIVTIVDRGYADLVIDAAKDAGARGGTVLYARGSGIHENDKFFKTAIQPEKEVILTLVKKEKTKDITRAIVEAAGLTKEGRGICFTLPVTGTAGIGSSSPKFDSGENITSAFAMGEGYVDDEEEAKSEADTIAMSELIKSPSV
jgi:nitrogen regulatory protein PII